MIARQVRDAFGDVGVPADDEMLFVDYPSVDAEAMRVVWRQRHWTELTVREVFTHREAIFALSGVGYRAYVGAFLVEAISDEPERRCDIRGYLLSSLRPTADANRTRRQAAQLSLLDDKQRAAIVAVLRHCVYRFGERDAVEVLAIWGQR